MIHKIVSYFVILNVKSVIIIACVDIVKKDLFRMMACVDIVKKDLFRMIV